MFFELKVIVQVTGMSKVTILSEEAVCSLSKNFFVVLDKSDLFRDLSEILYNECESLTKDSAIMKHAGFGLNSQVDKMHRADEICFITPELCERLQLSNMKKFIKSIITDLKKMKCTMDHIESLKLNGDFSVQLSIYRGNSARYIRHLDGGRDNNPSSRNKRKLTFIYYLNKEHKGGQLRLYVPKSSDSILMTAMVENDSEVDTSTNGTVNTSATENFDVAVTDTDDKSNFCDPFLCSDPHCRRCGWDYSVTQDGKRSFFLLLKFDS